MLRRSYRRRPTYRRTKKYGRKRTIGYSSYRRKYSKSIGSGYNIKTPVTRFISGVPERLFTKLRYVDVVNATVVAGVLSSFNYFQSSLFSPRNTGGHQPLYFDQWTPMFTKYRVYGIKYHVTIANRATNESYWFGIRHQESPTAETSLQTLLERNDSKVKQGGSVNGSQAIKVIKGYMDVSKTLGLSRTVVKNDDQYSSAVGTSPTVMAYLVPYILTNIASGTAIFEVTFRMTFYCELFNQVAVAAS